MPRFIKFVGVLALLTASSLSFAAVLVHPGIMHTKSDIDRIRLNLRDEPWASAYAKLSTSRFSSKDWGVRGGRNCPAVSRDSARNICIAQFNDDANAVYQNALMWVITRNQAHADKAIAIMNAWTYNLTSISGHDSRLAAGLNGFKFVAAAELLRYSKSGWSAVDIARAQSWIRGVLYPVVAGFGPDANGGYELATMKSVMAFGVFLDDRGMFNAAVDRFYNGRSNGALLKYVVNPSGQAQESGRDQAHTQLGLSELAEMAEIGWTQGMDLYSAFDNRLLKGFEYSASYNLGNSVSFSPYTDTTRKYSASTISSIARGNLRPIYEMVLNHYERRKGIAAPYTKQAAQRLRPEGEAPSADSPGFGTLLFSRSAGLANVGGTANSPNGFSKCASENGNCSVSRGTGMVAYGAHGRWHYKLVSVGTTLPCTNTTFAWDPLPGVRKTCSYQK